MKSERPGWVTNPTKKDIFLYAGLWVVGTALLVFAISNLFTENPFLIKNGMAFFLILLPLIFLFQMIRNYFINHKA